MNSSIVPAKIYYKLFSLNSQAHFIDLFYLKFLFYFIFQRYPNMSLSVTPLSKRIVCWKWLFVFIQTTDTSECSRSALCIPIALSQTLFERLALKGQDLIKLIISTASSRTFLTEAFFSKYVIVKNAETIHTFCCLCLDMG